MAIPPFNDDGLLPTGIHVATLEETIARFGGPSTARQAIAESLRWAIDAARRAGVEGSLSMGVLLTIRLSRTMSIVYYFLAPTTRQMHPPPASLRVAFHTFNRFCSRTAM